MNELLWGGMCGPRVRDAAVALTVGWLWSAEAPAGIVSFDAPLTVIDLAAGDDTLVTVDLTLTNLGRGEFWEIEAVVGSDDLRIVSFVFSPEVLSNPSYFFPSSPGAVGTYASDVSFGFVSMLGERPILPLLLGTLSVDASGLGPGTYDLIIDSDLDGLSFASLDSITEPISGRGTIQIVPEPATLMLLGVASIALLPRRRRR